jgi:hypothetical protein
MTKDTIRKIQVGRVYKVTNYEGNIENRKVGQIVKATSIRDREKHASYGRLVRCKILFPNVGFYDRFYESELDPVCVFDNWR